MLLNLLLMMRAAAELTLCFIFDIFFVHGSHPISSGCSVTTSPILVVDYYFFLGGPKLGGPKLGPKLRD